MDDARRRWADTSGEPATVAPATFQQGEWLAAVEGSSRSSVAYTWDLRGVVDEVALRDALQHLVERHEALRMTFRRGASGAEQVVWPAGKVDLAVVDLVRAGELDGGTVGRARAAREVERLAVDEVEVPLALDGLSPLWRGFLVRVERTYSVLVLVGHHVLLDGATQGVLQREIAALYRAAMGEEGAALAAPAAQLADFARWQRRPLTPASAEFWRGALARRAPLELPYAPGWTGGAFRLASHELPLIDAAAARALRNTAEAVRASFGSSLRALVAALFAPYAADEVVLGVVHANRRRPEFEGLIGEVADALPVRVDVSGDPSFSALVERAHEGWLDAREHAAPLGAIVEAVGGGLGVGGTLAFDVAVNWFPDGMGLPTETLPGRDGQDVTMAVRPLVDTSRATYDRAFHGGAWWGVNLFGSDRGAVVGDLWTPAGALTAAALADLGRGFGELVRAVTQGSEAAVRTLVPRLEP